MISSIPLSQHLHVCSVLFVVFLHPTRRTPFHAHLLTYSMSTTWPMAVTALVRTFPLPTPLPVTTAIPIIITTNPFQRRRHLTRITPRAINSARHIVDIPLNNRIPPIP